MEIKIIGTIEPKTALMFHFLRKSFLETVQESVESSSKSNTSMIWFEILVKDLDAAIDFYESVLDIDLEKSDKFGAWHAFFKSGRTQFTGTLIQSESSKVCNNVRLFFKVERLYPALKRVSLFGGEVITSPQLLTQRGTDGLVKAGSNLLDGKLGYICEILDGEGNTIFLYSNNLE